MGLVSHMSLFDKDVYFESRLYIYKYLNPDVANIILSYFHYPVGKRFKLIFIDVFDWHSFGYPISTSGTIESVRPSLDTYNVRHCDGSLSFFCMSDCKSYTSGCVITMKESN